MSRSNRNSLQGNRPTPIAQYQQVHYNGPLPPPAMLKQYDDIVPGAAERILKMAEEQSKHRQSLETAMITGNNKRATRGQIFGFILSMVVIVAGFLLIFFGKDALGLASILTAISALVIAFITGSVSRRRELQQKQ